MNFDCHRIIAVCMVYGAGRALELNFDRFFFRWECPKNVAQLKIHSKWSTEPVFFIARLATSTNAHRPKNANLLSAKFAYNRLRKPIRNAESETIVGSVKHWIVAVDYMKEKSSLHDESENSFKLNIFVIDVDGNGKL